MRATAFVCLVVLAACSAQAKPSSPPTSAPPGRTSRASSARADSIQSHFQAFYDAYAPLAQKDRVSPDSILAAAAPYVAASLLEAIRDDWKAQAADTSGQIVGIDWDPFVNGQDPWQRYRVGAVTLQGDSALVPVYGIRPDSSRPNAKPDAIAIARPFADGWRIVDVRDTSANQGLVAALKGLKADRDSAARQTPRGST